MLQRDAFGRRFERGADLRGSAEAWRDAIALDKVDEHVLGLAQVLVWSGEFAEAEKVARTASESEERDKWIVVAAAGGGGARPAIKAAGELRSGASRGRLIGLWRATAEIVGQSSHTYLVLDHGIAKVIGDDTAFVGVGRYVIDTIRAKGDAPARKLLDWVRRDLDKSTAPGALAFKKVWGTGLPSSREAILLAAAALAGGSDPDRMIAIGSQCASTVPDAELACHEMLVSAYLARERWADAVTELEAIELARPELAAKYVRPHVWALVRGGRADDAERLLDEALGKDPSNRDVKDMRILVAARRGAMPEALRRADAVAGDPQVTPSELNNIAWFRLGEGSDMTTALELARKAVEATKDSYAAVNTLAAIEAELGDLDRAITDNWKAMALGTSVAPLDGDWYVAGRIDEQLGLSADAVAAYHHIAPRSGDLGFSSYELAQKRLAALRHTR